MTIHSSEFIGWAYRYYKRLSWIIGLAVIDGENFNHTVDVNELCHLIETHKIMITETDQMFSLRFKDKEGDTFETTLWTMSAF